MFFFAALYVFKLFSPSYLPSIRDYIIIFSSLQFVVLVTLFFDVSKYRELSKSLLTLNVYMMAMVGVVSIFQMVNLFNIPDVLMNYYSNTNPEQRMEYLSFNPRATATFNYEPNTLGLYASLSLLVFHMFHKDLNINKLVAPLLYILGLLGLLLSGSVTGFLIYLITTLIYLIKYKKIGVKFSFGVLIIVLVIMNIFAEEIGRTVSRQKISSDSIIPSSLKHRINDRWLMVYKDFEKSPLIGIGPAAIQLTYATDNEYLDRFLRYGIFGGTAFILFILFLICYPIYKRTKISDKYIRKLYLLSSLLALSLALASLTGTAFKAKRVSEIFWIFYSLPFINVHLISDRLKVNKNEK